MEEKSVFSKLFPSNTLWFLASVLVLLFVVVWVYVYRNQLVTHNRCEKQDMSYSSKELVSQVADQFELFNSMRDSKRFSSCLSSSFVSSLAPRTNPFPFYDLVSYLIGTPVLVSDNTYSVDVSERRLIQTSGIGGGTYPEENITATLIIEKQRDGRWLVSSYYEKIETIIFNTSSGATPSITSTNWEAYKSNEHGFEFSYPDTLTVEHRYSSSGTPIYTFFIQGNKRVFTLNTPIRETGLETHELVSTNKVYVPGSNKILTDSLYQNYENGIPGTYLRKVFWDDKKSFQGHSFEFLVGFSSTSDENYKLFEQILTTLKFL